MDPKNLRPALSSMDSLQQNSSIIDEAKFGLMQELTMKISNPAAFATYRGGRNYEHLENVFVDDDRGMKKFQNSPSIPGLAKDLHFL